VNFQGKNKVETIKEIILGLVTKLEVPFGCFFQNNIISPIKTTVHKKIKNKVVGCHLKD